MVENVSRVQRTVVLSSSKLSCLFVKELWFHANIMFDITKILFAWNLFR